MKILRQTTDLCFCIYIVRVTYLVQDMYTIRDCEVYLQIDVARFADLFGLLMWQLYLPSSLEST